MFNGYACALGKVRQRFIVCACVVLHAWRLACMATRWRHAAFVLNATRARARHRACAHFSLLTPKQSFVYKHLLSQLPSLHLLLTEYATRQLLESTNQSCLKHLMRGRLQQAVDDAGRLYLSQ